MERARDGVQVTRPSADDLMASYDDAVSGYRLAVRLGMGEAGAFEKWQRAREALIDQLCGEGEVFAADAAAVVTREVSRG